MPNKWIEHVRAFAKKNNIAYGCAISNPDCKSSYNKVKSPQKVKSDNTEINNLEYELRDAEKEYYARLNTGILASSLTGKRTKYSLANKPTDWSNTYTKLKDKLQKLTGKTYPTLQSITDFKKQNKIDERRIIKADKEKEILRLKEADNRPILPSPFADVRIKKKKTGVISAFSA